MRNEDQRKKLLRLLSKLDVRLSNPYMVGSDFEYKIRIIHKFSKRRVYILENHFQKFPEKVELTLADVIEIIRDIIDVPDSFEEYCDTVIGADEDNEIDRIDYEDYREGADRLTRVVTKKEITSIPVLRELPEAGFITEQDVIEKIKEHNLRRAQKNGIPIIRVDVEDHDKLVDYFDALGYHKKLMKQYGYDEITEDFNYRLFPVPKSDKELEGARKDIDKFFKVQAEYNDFIKYLVRKYHVNIGEEELRDKGVIIQKSN